MSWPRHVVFEIESIDRMYCNVYQPRLVAERIALVKMRCAYAADEPVKAECKPQAAGPRSYCGWDR
ncbi:MAG: hypothetical protein QOE61_1426 [Micromonosporaceae bacterium]|jgi:hypothetical protein|nr:hypothetical protein [Micromonosporaceae bacterium]